MTLPDKPDRSLSILADRASIGLSMLRRGQQLDDDIRRALQDGIYFSDKVLESLSQPAGSTPTSATYELQSMGTSETRPSTNYDATIDALRRLRTFLVDISNSTADITDTGLLDDARTTLFKVGMKYYEDDVSDMRQTNEKLGLKAYG